jgi:hypothetical protein
MDHDHLGDAEAVGHQVLVPTKYGERVLLRVPKSPSHSVAKEATDASFCHAHAQTFKM